ncbi:putative membrane protein [Afipia carboxidovorans OM5]|uniref:DUF2157 domain-containing protein n=1 Tax=Afipia carboxidovorans (strain ATCC 49405 / DSM 1227 / KCTC 32145 / OM5) TaxID=504832 RepID=B6JIN6_AFIC5|nr:hypothetical protein [Afipia carboxidovorans]ACI94286.1 putative membrane protein [Afipia carboxidovorans OM5]AEI02073.1 hypothetical protein OCA4_c09260 [Afipia carboxidovorans OM4]AEI05649.1 hypothetical protein OCA5_c09270 [Afipia carboxidovorans OM5]
MSYSKTDLRAASEAGIISPGQLESLLTFLQVRGSASPATAKFDVVHVLWYAGALIVISAMGLFSTLAFAQMGGKALTATALIYAAVFAYAGHYLWTVKNLRTPGGLLIAIAVSMAPLAVYGMQHEFGLWNEFGKPDSLRGPLWLKGSWFPMEIATIAASAVALRFYRFPFFTFIMALALWFLSMDLAQWIVGKPHNWEISRQVSIWLGLAMLAAAVVVNARQRAGDFAFWLYLFGVLAFWGGISFTTSGTALQKAAYCAMNVGFLFLAVFLGRRVFAVAGTIGIALYLGDLAAVVFKDSLLFPFALSLIGVAIIAFGLYYHRYQAAITAWVDARMPAMLKRLRPADTGA